MKRLLLLSFVFSSFVLSAQNYYDNEANKSIRTETEESTDIYKVETNRFGGNWFVTLGGGGQIYFGDHDKQVSFSNRLTPAIDFGVGKWFTPGIGVRLMYTGDYVKGATKRENDAIPGAHRISNEFYPGISEEHNLCKQQFSYFHVHGDVMFNLSHLLLGYVDGGRLWNVSPYVGLGMARVYESPKVDEVTFSYGILNSFNVAPAIDINLDVRSFMVNDRFDGEIGGRKQEGLLSATVGISYKFGKRNWDRSTKTYIYDETELNNLRRQFDELDAENQRLREALAAGNRAEAKRIIEKMQVPSPLLVTFQINKSNLSNEARANLGMLAE
jgi:hypothetical protein